MECPQARGIQTSDLAQDPHRDRRGIPGHPGGRVHHQRHRRCAMLPGLPGPIPPGQEIASGEPRERRRVPSTPANLMAPSPAAALARSSRPQERQTLEARHCRGSRPQRGPAHIEALRAHHPAAMERPPPPKPRRDMSRARHRPGGSFSRRLDALRQVAGPTPDRAGSRPSARRAPGPCRRSQRLHRARNTRNRGCGMSPARGKGKSAPYLICATEPLAGIGAGSEVAGLMAFRT